MNYIIQVLDPSGEWQTLRTSGGIAYLFPRREDAERIIRLCYRGSLRIVAEHEDLVTGAELPARRELRLA